MSQKKILLIDDDVQFLKLTQKLLQHAGWVVFTASSLKTAEEETLKNGIHVFLIDLTLGKENGLEGIIRLRQATTHAEIIMMTGNPSVDTAVNAFKNGASDYLSKPCDPDELICRIENVWKNSRHLQELNDLKKNILNHDTFHGLVSKNKDMQAIFHLIGSIGASDATVLIHGETGTGKELIAKSIHLESGRNSAPFVTVNCAGLNENLLESHLFGHVRGAFTGALETKEGKFYLAANGTIFLDEISETSSNFQKKLLRVLQEKTYERVGEARTRITEARVIAATNKDLLSEVQKGNFREDLYYRLNVININVPPLRKRKDDIPYLFATFLSKFQIKYGKEHLTYTPEDILPCLHYDWPGNVRELENYVEKNVILSKNGLLPKMDQFGYGMSVDSKENPMVSYEEFLNSAEERYFKDLFQVFKGNVVEIANVAKTSKKTVYQKAKKYNLH